MCLCNSIPFNSITSINRTINLILPAGFCVPHKLFQQSLTCFSICSTKHKLFQSMLYHNFFKVISNTTVSQFFSCTTRYLQYLTLSLMVYYSFSIVFSPVNSVTIATVSYCICDGFSQYLNFSSIM